jgi:hypothetical protein
MGQPEHTYFGSKMKIERRTILLLLLVVSVVGKGAMASTVREKFYQFSLVAPSLVYCLLRSALLLP